MTDMPTTYESKTTTTVSSGPSRSTIGCHPEYLRTIPGILKIVEIVLCLIVIICDAAPVRVGYVGSFADFSPGGWVMFVAVTAIISTALLLIAHMVQLFGMVNAPWSLIVLSLIAFICACVGYWGGAQGWVRFVSISAFISILISLILHLLNLISRFPGPWLFIEFIYYCIFTVFFLISFIVSAVYAHGAASIGACAFFCAAATAVYAVDTFFQFRAWRTGETEMVTTTTTTSTQQATVQY